MSSPLEPQNLTPCAVLIWFQHSEGLHYLLRNIEMITVILFAMPMYTEPKCCGSQTVVRGPLGDMKSLKGTLRGIVLMD